MASLALLIAHTIARELSILFLSLSRDVKLDLKSPGTLLLREPTGLVHYLAFGSLSQVDLSDDEVVGAVAVSGWVSGLLSACAQFPLGRLSEGAI